ncbi:MAG: hypothetical protein V4555_14910 [Acidobacteriota bacterium]
MTTPSKGKYPLPASRAVIVAHPSTKLPTVRVTGQRITPEGVKSAFLGKLGSAVGQYLATQKIEEATFSLFADTLVIQTNLPEAALHAIFDGVPRSLMESVLRDYGEGNVRIRLLPERPDKVGTPSSDNMSLFGGSTHLKRLADSAAKLNEVSDRLTKQIEQIDAALKRLNLGVTAWVTIFESEDEDGNCLREELGYTRIGSRWGVALRTASGTRGDECEPDRTFSAFADAPRQLRIKAVEHIPKLLDQISADAEAMVEKLTPEVAEVAKLTHALEAIPGVKK